MSLNDDNPFGDPTDSNLFSDPSISGIMNKPNEISIENLDETKSSPAVMAPVTSQVNTRGRQAISDPPLEFNQHIQQRREQLETHISNINRSDEERGQSYNVRSNNWPPLPDFCCWKPCFFQDISIEIRPEFQSIVRQLYYLWLLHACLLLVNIFGMLLLWITLDDMAYEFFLSIFHTFILVTTSFLCWYRPIYKAFYSDSSINFMVFFLAFLFQLVMSIIQAFGFSGFCGFINVVKVFNNGNIFIGIITLCIATGFTILAIMDVLMISEIHRIYKSTGATVSKARDEFTSGFIRNQHVQNIASNAATSAINNQLRNGRY